MSEFVYRMDPQGWLHRATNDRIHDCPGTCRPIVVIDPEDAEQVGRLLTLVDEWASRVPYEDMRKPGDLTGESALANALREFARPTPSCGAHLSVTRSHPNSHDSYTCTLDAGHRGAHEAGPAEIVWRESAS